MSNTFKYLALAAFIGAAGTAQADPAETKGGIKIKTEDGRFEATVGGRIQFDYYSFSEDEDASIALSNGTRRPFGSGNTALGKDRGGAQFRRTYLTLTGKAYGWDYKFENDFSRSGTTGGNMFREMWIGTQVGPGKLIIGQHKALRSMDEMTSSNEITFMERPVNSASGIYANRQFLTGLFYKGVAADQFGYGLYAATLGDAGIQTEGSSFGGRAYWFPFAEDGKALHLGISYSTDREDANSAAAAAAFQYGGRRGVTGTLANAGAALTTGVPGISQQDTVQGELGGAFGSFHAEGEYAIATYEDAYGTTGAPKDTDVTAYYVQAGYFVTGEKKVYKKDRGAFGSPKPNNSFGAVEVVARYESISNDETGSTTNGGCVTPAAGGAALPAGVTVRAATKCDISQITLGANWFVNPNVRFMLNYYLAEADYGVGKDEPEGVSVRAQFGF